MNKCITIAVIFLFMGFSHAVIAQIQRGGMEYAGDVNEIRGVILDSTGMARLPFAHVFFIQGGDTTRLVADMYGAFVYKGKLTDTMRLRVTAVGYKTFEENYYLKQHGFDIRVFLKQEKVALNEIIIIGKRIAMVVKGDTLQYNAEAFTALEGDFMDVLLKKMPGVTYKDGALMVNGEHIQRVYVNGSDALFKNASDVFQNVKADNVKNIKVYDERNKDDQKLGLKYGRRETVMDVTTKQKINAVKRSSILLGGGVDISADRTTEFKEKYNGKLDYSYYVPGKNLTFSLYATNVSSDLSVEQRNFGGLLNLSKDLSKTFKFSTNNSYDNKVNYHNSWSSWDYFPTAQFDSRSYENRLRNTNRQYVYNTQNSFQWNRYGLLQGQVMYKYMGNKFMQFEQSSSLMNGKSLASAEVKDYSGDHFSDFYSSLSFGKSLPRGMMLNVAASLTWKEGTGDGWRIDTLEESTKQINLDKDMNYKDFGWLGRIQLQKKLSSKWRTVWVYIYECQEQASQGEVMDLITGKLDTTNTRDYSIAYKQHTLSPGFSFNSKKSSLFINLSMKNIQRRHVEHFPTYEKYDDDYLFFAPSFQLETKFSSTSNIEAACHINPKLPTIEQTRAVLNDLNPLSLYVGNKDIQVPLEYSARFIWNKTFIAQASSLRLFMSYILEHDYIATNSRYFTTDTFLTEYNYTACRGATLYTVENTNAAHRLTAHVNYSKLSNWLKSRVTVSAEYRYWKTPSFLQGEMNTLIRNSGNLRFNVLTNFSRKIEFSLTSETNLSHFESLMSEASKILKEELKFDVRTDFIPKFHITSTIRYKLEKEMATGGVKYDEMQWKVSMSRKIGQITLSLDGYNLLDAQEATTLTRTSEYLSQTEKSQTGRFVLFSLAYSFK